MMATTYRSECVRLKKQLEFANARIAQLELKAKFYDVVLAAKGAVPTRRIAEHYGLTSNGVHKILEEMKILYKHPSNGWCLYAKYAKKGYYAEKAAIFTDDAGETYVKFTGVWTPKGQAFIHTILQGKGYQILQEETHDTDGNDGQGE